MTCDYEVGYCCGHALENSRHMLEMPKTLQLVMNKDTSMDQQHGRLCSGLWCEDQSLQ